MLSSKKFNNKILRFIVMSILILIFFIAPSVIKNKLPLGETATLVIAQQTQHKNNNEVENPPSSQRDEGKNGDENKSKEEGKLDIFKIVTGALAGLVLFLYGVTRMAEGLEAIAGDCAKKLISKFTTNRYAGVATGTVATTILDSSSVTIIIVIAMVSAGLLTFVESLGVVLGATSVRL